MLLRIVVVGLAFGDLGPLVGELRRPGGLAPLLYDLVSSARSFSTADSLLAMLTNVRKGGGDE